MRNGNGNARDDGARCIAHGARYRPRILLRPDRRHREKAQDNSQSPDPSFSHRLPPGETSPYHAPKSHVKKESDSHEMTNTPNRIAPGGFVICHLEPGAGLEALELRALSRSGVQGETARAICH